MSNFKFQIPNKSKSSKILKIKNWKLEIPAWQAGFSIPELIAIMSIMVILIGFAALNLTRAQNSTTMTSTTDALIADIKAQQVKAMVSDTEGRSVSDSYGVHFISTKYILFHGSSYNANDSSNLAVTIDAGVQFSGITFPGSNIVFTQGSGEVASYSGTTNSIVLQTVNGQRQSKTITINKYGVVTSVQ